MKKRQISLGHIVVARDFIRLCLSCGRRVEQDADNEGRVSIVVKMVKEGRTVTTCSHFAPIIRHQRARDVTGWGADSLAGTPSGLLTGKYENGTPLTSSLVR